LEVCDDVVSEGGVDIVELCQKGNIADKTTLTEMEVEDLYGMGYFVHQLLNVERIRSFLLCPNFVP
jgi:hypothetical protein